MIVTGSRLLLRSCILRWEPPFAKARDVVGARARLTQLLVLIRWDRSDRRAVGRLCRRWLDANESDPGF